MILRRGDQGPDVAALKQLLKNAGFILSSTEVFDLATACAVRTAQEKHGLEKDGIVGPKTLRELRGSKPLFNEPTNPFLWIQPCEYYPQRDNEYHPDGTCNVTSLAMVLASHGVRARSGQLEDELFQQLQTAEAQEYFNGSFPQLKRMGYKPRHIHGMLGWLAQKRGFSWKFTEQATWTEMATWGREHGPLITSGAFTRAGHIITIVGMTQTRDLIVHDPWGDWHVGYRHSHDGKYRIYNRESMEQILAGRSKNEKRCHFIRPQQ